jgi:hypothetical protein
LFGGVNLVYPTSFDISTPSDYLAIISEGVKAGVPPSITFSNVYNYIRAIHYTDEETSAVYDLIINADELLLMSNADILARLASGSVEKWQDVLHNSGPQLIMELIRDFIPTEGAERFLDLPMSEQITQLRAKAAEKIAVTDLSSRQAGKEGSRGGHCRAGIMKGITTSTMSTQSTTSLKKKLMLEGLTPPDICRARSLETAGVCAQPVPLRGSELRLVVVDQPRLLWLDRFAYLLGIRRNPRPKPLRSGPQGLDLHSIKRGSRDSGALFCYWLSFALTSRHLAGRNALPRKT